MSSILKALKKLEEENARREGGATDIARDILRISPRKKQSPWLLPTTTVICALFLACSFLLMRTSEDAPLYTESPRLKDPALPSQVAPHRTQDRVVVSQPEGSKPIARDTAPREMITKSDTRLPEPAAPPVVAPPKSPSPLLPNLVVTGIAYQDDRQSRMAIINDLPAMEGTHVDLALIEEILPDRVIFSFEGRMFEIPLKVSQ